MIMNFIDAAGSLSRSLEYFVSFVLNPTDKNCTDKSKNMIVDWPVWTLSPCKIAIPYMNSNCSEFVYIPFDTKKAKWMLLNYWLRFRYFFAGVQIAQEL